MKLKYTKPALVMERFELTQSIANGCTAENPASPSSSIGDPNHWTKSTCGWDVGNYVLWIKDSGICTIDASPDEEVMGLCYNNPSGGNVIFSS